jgi:hypothetical protein
MKGENMTTQNASGKPAGAPPAFGRYRLDDKLFDEGMNQVDAFTLRQDVYMAPGGFVLRLTRKLADGRQVQYEDRGRIDDRMSISGSTGFGGELRGQAFPSGSVFLRGEGGTASFIMVATVIAPDHARCLRRIEVRKPARFATAEDLTPGVYYFTTEDYLEEASDEPPPELKEPLKS